MPTRPLLCRRHTLKPHRPFFFLSLFPLRPEFAIGPKRFQSHQPEIIPARPRRLRPLSFSISNAPPGMGKLCCLVGLAGTNDGDGGIPSHQVRIRRERERGSNFSSPFCCFCRFFVRECFDRQNWHMQLFKGCEILRGHRNS